MSASAEADPLIKPPKDAESGDEVAEEQSFLMKNIKTVSLALLVMQNSAQFMVTGFSRRPPEKGEYLYLVSVAVLFAEMGKALLCACVIMWSNGGLPALVDAVRQDIVEKPVETIKVGVPAFCYTLQNNLLFVALSNLPPAVCQVMYQTKTLSTALFSVLILQKALGGVQWFALFLLVVGVVLVQHKDEAAEGAAEGANTVVGLVAVASCSLLSGCAPPRRRARKAQGLTLRPSLGWQFRGCLPREDAQGHQDVAVDAEHSALPLLRTSSDPCDRAVRLRRRHRAGSLPRLHDDRVVCGRHQHRRWPPRGRCYQGTLLPTPSPRVARDLRELTTRTLSWAPIPPEIPAVRG